MLGRTDRRWRSAVILIAMCAFAFAAVIRLAYWQVAEASWLRERAQGQLQQTATENALRGDILDRNGRVLATTGFRDTLAAWPNQMYGGRGDTIEKLAEILELDEAARAKLEELLDPKSQYETVRRELTEDQSRAVRAGIADMSLRGLVLLPHAVRIYPNPGGQPDTTLASQLLGFVRSSDGTGHYGIEGQYNDILAGQPRKVATARGQFGRTLGSTEVLDPGADGEDITISIDASLQLQLEKELYAAWVADKAKRVSGLVMDPDSGEVLAWASVPGYDANDSGDVATNHVDLLLDPIISQFYEPGSVMKMLTAASALENGVVTPITPIVDSRRIRFGTRWSATRTARAWAGSRSRTWWRTPETWRCPRSPLAWDGRPRAPRSRSTRPGTSWASGSRRASTWRVRSRAWHRTPGTPRGPPWILPTAPSGKAWRPPPSSWRPPSRP